MNTIRKILVAGVAATAIGVCAPAVAAANPGTGADGAPGGSSSSAPAPKTSSGGDPGGVVQVRTWLDNLLARLRNGPAAR